MDRLLLGCLGGLLGCVVACGGAAPQIAEPRPRPSATAPAPASSSEPLRFPKLPPGPTTTFTIGDFVGRVPGQPGDDTRLAYNERPLMLYTSQIGDRLRLEIWDVEQGRMLRSLPRGSGPVTWEPTGQRVAVGCAPTKVYEVTTGHLVGSFESPRPPPPKPKPRPRRTRSPPGRLGGLSGLSGGGGGGVGFGAGIGRLGGGRGGGVAGSTGPAAPKRRRAAVDACSVFVGQDRLLTVDARGSHLWQIASGRRLVSSSKLTTTQYDLAADPQGNTIAYLGAATLGLLDARTLKPLREVKLSGEAVTFAPDGKRLALATTKGVSFLEVSSLAVTAEVEVAAPDSDRPLAYSADGRVLYTLSGDRLGQVDVPSAKLLPVPRALFPGRVVAVGAIPQQRLLVTASGKQVAFFDAQTGSARGGWSLANAISDLAVLPGGQAVVVQQGPTLSLVALTDLETPRRLAEAQLDATFEPHRHLSVDAAGELLGVPGAGLFLLPELTLKAQGVNREPLGFMGGSLAVLSADGDQVRGTSPDDLNQVFLAAMHGSPIDYAAWSKLGWVIASADGDIRTWDAKSGELLRSFQAHYGSIEDAALAPNGRLLATTAGGEVRIWDLASGYALLDQPLHRGDITRLAFTHDSARLISASVDGTVKLTQVPAAAAEPKPAVASAEAEALAACEQGFARVEARKKAPPSSLAQLSPGGLSGLLRGQGLGGLALLGGKGHYQTDEALTPREIAQTSWTDIALGDGFRCGLTTSGLVSCSQSKAAGAGSSVTWGPDALAVLGVADAKQIAAGQDFACARLANGQVRCWGANSDGQLGDGSRRRRNESTQVILPGKAERLAVGAHHACAVLADGTKPGRVACWGSGSDGQLGNAGREDSQLAVSVCGVRDAVDLALGDGFSCALLGSGSVSCWGRGLGLSSDVPLEFEGLTNVSQLVAGDAHACALDGGRAMCWGEGGFGQLGNGKKKASVTPVAVDLRRVAKGKRVKALYAGDKRSCARFADGGLACWGAGTQGQLGDASKQDRASPVRVQSLSKVSALATRGEQTCALAAGKLLCWGTLSKTWVYDEEPTYYGLGGSGLGGGGPGRPRKPPAVSEVALASVLPRPGVMRVPELDHATSVFATLSGYCGLLSGPSGLAPELRCVQSEPEFALPAPGSLPGPASQGFTLAGSSLSTACIATSDARVACQQQANQPWHLIKGVAGAKSIAVGYQQACAVDGGGRVWCWSYAPSAGAATRANAPKPKPIDGVSGATKVVTSASGETCALTSTREVWCWGGEPPIGAADESPPSPLPPKLWLTDALDVTDAKEASPCALTAGGAISCRSTRYEETFDAPQISGATAISIGGAHGCAVLSDGSVSCWGANEKGQLGAGRLSRDFAAKVTGLPKIKQVVAGAQATCAMSEQGELWCWGDLPEP